MANILTLGRILLVLPFAALFFIDRPFAMAAAFVLFTVAALTDLLDGWVARARNETSALGAALDPIADKLLLAAALLLLTRNGVISGTAVVAALAILLREIGVAGLREALAQRRLALPVTRLAKWKTAAQLIAVAVLIAAAPGSIAPATVAGAGTALLWLAAALTLWTGAEYAFRAAKALRAAPPEA
ncbi:MAG: CDP-diacylglycerol--glycerol-3-phosphate 3-phosphatidyltransferase [Parvularculaceae bacterium]|jgi:CDP-diacylglycerol--glycerol-3-phosphate 3-phosphatidyltransferase|nr:CDP-diacylglycerol--glycerol-3-phosphate 3-phosphatidyltransferase [Parvularculaceae bacterium]